MALGSAVIDGYKSATAAWAAIWSTKIGTEDMHLSLAEINPPATVIGYLFEKFFAKMLSAKYATEWEGGTSSGRGRWQRD